jgi:tetratricopeptide (TPR) repeat protein
MIKNPRLLLRGGLFLFLILLSTGAFCQFDRISVVSDSEIPLSKADSLYFDRQFDQAILVLDSIITSHEKVTSAEYYNRGLLDRICDSGNGLDYFRKSFKIDKETYLTSWSYGLALTDVDSLKKGEELLRIAVSLDKGYYESSVDLARNLRLQGRYKEALKSAKKSFGHDRTYARAFIEMSRIYLASSEPVKALEILKTGVSKFPYEELLIELIPFYLDSDYEQLVSLCEEYISLYPKGPNLSVVIGILEKHKPDALLGFSGEYQHFTYPDGEPFADPAEVVPVNKNWHYTIRWGLISVGTLDIDVVEGEYKGQDTWYIRYVARSNPGLPFISINDTMYAHVDRNVRFTRRFDMQYEEKDYSAHKTYDSDYESGVYEARVRLGNGYWIHKDHPLPPSAFDASSQMFLAQQMVLARTGGHATVELSGGFERTIINIKEPDGKIVVDGIETHQILIDGIMRYSGIAGLTGEYRGWYTADHRAIPTKAKFKIFLGWVTLDFKSTGPTTFDPGKNKRYIAKADL